jgi:cytochrome c-type biogenesis protein CcmH
MMLWPVLGLMTAAAIVAVVWPLFRRGATTRSGSDVAVYRDQLNELDRDLASGLIGKTEADAARIEISRRLLAAADAAEASPAVASSAAAAWRRYAVLIVALVVLPAGVVGLYLRLGSPELATLAAAGPNASAGQDSSVEAMVVRIEAHLQRNPKDGRGWEVLAPVYLRLGRYSDSVTAWRNALQLLGENADREANLGESLTAEANGIVTDDAKAAFDRAVKLDSTSVTARYYLGIAAEQDGDREKAAKILSQLIAEAPADAHWVDDVRKALARVEGKAPAPPAASKPEQAATVAKEPPEQSAMIRKMVERLAERLKENGADPDGWIRLVRSYKVLGEADRAQSAIADARRALAGDADKLKHFEAALKTMDSSAAAAPVAPAPAPPADSKPEQAAAIGKLPPEQSTMIRGMVERLAGRLKENGADPDGWIRLVRSYKVLGEADKAQSAIADARRALAGDIDKLQRFEAALKTMDSSAAAALAAPAPEANAAQLPQPAAPPGHEQGATIQAMVDRLAARLKTSPLDPEGWLMLTRSYLTIGQKDKATAVIKDARGALASDPEKLTQFNEALKHFKIAE